MRAEVFNIRYEPPPEQGRLGRELARKYSIHDTAYLTSCSVCHR